MSETPLIDQIYNKKECEAIREFHKEEPQTRQLLREAIGSKLVTAQDKIIHSNAIDAICLMCLTAKFADSEDECHRVAITVYQHHDKTKDILPSLVSDRDLKFANKTLITLSFYPQALEKKWKFHGAPKPDFYRQLSKTVYRIHDQNDIASHHEQWEAFLSEIFI